jgi:hypothetical protein
VIKFFFVDTTALVCILTIYMARIFSLRRKSTLALRQRKERLLHLITVSPDSIRASFVERYSVCGKRHCACRHGGAKHGPFYYLTQCLGVGQIRKFLLRTADQQQAAQQAIEHYRQFQELLEELSQINTELLRREESL